MSKAIGLTIFAHMILCKYMFIHNVTLDFQLLVLIGNRCLFFWMDYFTYVFEYVYVYLVKPNVKPIK